MYQHKNYEIKWFTQKYWINKLMYYEAYNDVRIAIEREKQLKAWSRQKKKDLIYNNNPYWIDLYYDLIK